MPLQALLGWINHPTLELELDKLSNPTARLLACCPALMAIMPRCKTPESAAAYHLFRQRLTEVKRMEREERLRSQKHYCWYCQQCIGFINVTWWDSELEEVTGRSVPVDYGTTTPHDCPVRKRERQDFALAMRRAYDKKKQLEGLLHPNSSR